MRVDETIDIEATPETIWTVLMDVEAWQEWTDSMTSLSLLEAPPLRTGSRVRIKQPRLPATVWTVTSIEPNHQFTWQARNPGVKVVAVHRIEPLGEGRSRVTLSVDQSGPLAWLAALLFGRLGRRYVRMEAEGLKRRSEHPGQA
jgi:uncharacterized protein YndB with AHSA1/START domain